MMKSRSEAVPDPLTQVVDLAHSKLADRKVPIKTRVRSLWNFAKAARDCGSSDVVLGEFTKLADITGLTADLGRHGAEDVRHVLSWAMRGLNPFEDGPPHEKA
jgi:hypothetical protein